MAQHNAPKRPDADAPGDVGEAPQTTPNVSSPAVATPPWSWRYRVRIPRRLRSWRLALAVAVLALLALVLWRPVQVGVKTLLLLPAVFPSAPVNPLLAWTAPPLRTEHRFAYAAGTVDVDLYHPAGAAPRSQGGAILLLGARPVPRRDPILVRFAEALARNGAVILVPESSNLLDGRVLPEERDALRLAYELLVAQPEVDPARTGFIGFSVGGALSLIAAADPALRDRVRFVNSLGGYVDARLLLVDVASRSLLVDGRVVPWQPAPLAMQVVALQIVETLPDAADRALLTRAFVNLEPVDDAAWAALTPAGQETRELLGSPTRARAEALVARLPEAGLRRLAAISPSTTLADLRARVFLMHDTGDAYIGYTHSRQAARDIPPASLARFTEFTIFQHVIPDRPVPWQTFLPDLWSLYRHLHAVMMELL